MEFYEEWLSEAVAFSEEKRRPLINLCYAQSIDGSIAAKPGRRLALSGEESRTLTHKLRARHDAILVGIGTVLSDDPLLTVRFVEGTNPQPVIIDSVLKIPLHSRLINENPTPALIITTSDAPADRIVKLQTYGARVEILPCDSSGRLDLQAVLKRLFDLGIKSVMVEGGERIISSFLSQKLPDHLILTIAMHYIGGYHISLPQQNSFVPNQISKNLPRLDKMGVSFLGNDLIIWGDLVFTNIT